MPERYRCALRDKRGRLLRWSFRGPPPASRLRPRRGARLAGELDRERRAFPDPALHFDGSAVRLHDLPRDVEPQAEAAVLSRRNGALEPLEDAVDSIAGDTDAMIAHGDSSVGTRAFDGYLHWRTSAVFQRIGEQVGDHLVDAERVPKTEHRTLGAHRQDRADAQSL